jgi:hypothetical protein
MSVDTEYFIEGLEVMFSRSFDVLSDVRSNDIVEMFGYYIGDAFLVMGYIFSLCFLNEINDRLIVIHL